MGDGISIKNSDFQDTYASNGLSEAYLTKMLFVWGYVILEL